MCTINNVRERDVEKYLVEKLESIGLKCMKFLPDMLNGMPDRLVLLPDRQVVWVELKTKGGAVSELQKLRHRELERRGHVVEIVWTKDQVDELARRLRKGMMS